MKYIGVGNGDDNHERVNLEKVIDYSWWGDDYKESYRIRFSFVSTSTTWYFDSKEEMFKIFDKVEKAAGVLKLDQGIQL